MSHHLNLAVSSQEPEDMEIAYKALKIHDNLIYRDHYVDTRHNSDLEVQENEDLHEINKTNEEKKLQETLVMIRSSAAVRAKIASEAVSC